ncbi:hypothetical protein HK102_012182, partial [Quaeritorhiza haematococci]
AERKGGMKGRDEGSLRAAEGEEWMVCGFPLLLTDKKCPKCGSLVKTMDERRE